MSDSRQKCIGIDSTSEKFEIYIQPKEEEITISRGESDIEKLVQSVSSIQPQIAALISTTEEIELLVSLILADIRVVLVSPDKLQEKFNHIETEARYINAEKLADFASTVKPEIFTIREIDKVKIQDSLSIYKELQKTIAIEKNKLLNIENIIKDSLNKHISWLEDRVEESSKQIFNILDKYTKWEISPDAEHSLTNKEITNHKSKEAISAQNSSPGSVNKLPTKKVIKRYRGQVYEEEVIDYAKVKQLNLNKQKERRKYRGQYID